MRPLPLLLALLLPLGAPLAAETAVEPASTAVERRADVPATVLGHTLEVTIDSSLRLRTLQTWTVRIEDPAAASAGLRAPPGLDGAADRGATVLGELLLLPSDAQAGAVYTLRAEERLRRGPYSGVFASAPDLPVEETVVTVSMPSWIDAQVWFDETADAAFAHTRSTRTAEVRWTAQDASTQAQLVWTSWSDWTAAGEQLTKHTDALLADKKALGRALAAESEGVSVPALVDRVNQRVQVYPEDYGTWEAASSAADVLEAREGTAADRGIVLLSLLRVAGYDARPALFRPASPTRTAPLSVPAPAQLVRPAVAVFNEGRVLWIDPASTHTAVPDLPASLIGGVAWAPGNLPVEVARHGAMDGMVIVNGQMTLNEDGTSTWGAKVTATGSALEWLRTFLSPLAESQREQALLDLASKARPDLQRFAVNATGIVDPDRALRIDVNGFDEHAIGPLGPGYVGTVPPLLAPALAAWLPPRVLVHEELSIESPGTLRPVATVPPARAFHEGVVLSQSSRRVGDRIVATTEALRPPRTDTPSRAARAAAFLDAESRSGPQILYFGLASPPLVKAVRADERIGSEAERIVTEVLIWLTSADEARAKKAFKKALVTVPPDDLADAIRRYASPEDAAPWHALHGASKDEKAQVVALEGLSTTDAARPTWLAASALLASESPEVRLRACRIVYALQPTLQPDPQIDAKGAEAWRAPSEVLATAHEASRQIAPGPVGGDVAILMLKAERDLDQGHPEEAQVVLARILESHDHPLALVLELRARAMLGAPSQDLVESLREAVRRAPFDADVLSHAAETLSLAGRRIEALEYSLSAARLAGADPVLWDQTATFAVAAGDLESAVYAARKASDLAPEDAVRGEALRVVATLAADQEAATLGTTRAGKRGRGQWPAGLADILAQTPPEALLAVLQFHEQAVVRDGRLLEMRARLRLDAGLLDEAARDGAILATQHSDARGYAIEFAATAGRLWSSSGKTALDRAADHPEIRDTRMEYALVSGAGDAYAAARTLTGDPRAQILLDLKAGTLASDWPVDLVDPKAKPMAGYRPNAVLGAPGGVAAWSDPDRATAILLVADSTDAWPAPLPQLFTPRTPDEATLPDGGRLVRLEGGSLPLYAAMAPLGDQRVIALGFTGWSARRALSAALDAWQVE